MIVQEGNSWCLYSKDGTKKLGSYPTEAAAKKREAEIMAAEHARGDRAHRYDAGELIGPKRMPNGWLRVDARLTRTGVFVYSQPDGSKRHEYRPPEEVFDAATLDSFALVPVTDEHPPAFLTADNTKEYSRGAAGEAPKRDGIFVRSPLLITDSELVGKLESGDARQVSCGYTCDLEERAGVAPDGQRYDAVQRNIRGNHVAVVPRGRAGAEVRVRMDVAPLDEGHGPVLRISTSGGGKQPPNQSPKSRGQRMIRIDGIDYDTSTPEGRNAAAQALAKLDSARAAELAKLQADAKAAVAKADATQAKLDSVTGELEKAQKEIAEMPKKLAERAAARVELETAARKVLGKKAKLDADDKAVRIAVLEHLFDGTDFSKKSDAYLEARFDAAVEAFDEDAEQRDDEEDELADDLDEERDDADDLDDEGDEDDERDDSESGDTGRARMLKDNRNAWKKTTKRLGIES